MPEERLVVAAHELYGGAPSDFVARRAAIASRASDRGESARIRRLAKPTAAAAVVNALVRAEPETVPSLSGIGERLRAAAEAGDAAALRDLAHTRRRAIARATASAVAASETLGMTVAAGTRDAVEATLQAAVLDEGAARAVASGLLVAALQPGADVRGVTAIPQDGLPPMRSAGRSGTQKAAADPDATRRARAEAQRAESEARGAAAAREDAERSLESARSRRNAIRRRLGALRDEVADLEGQEAEVSGDVAHAERTRRDLAAAERKARVLAEELRRQAR